MFNNRIKQLQKIKVIMLMKIQYTVLKKLSVNSEFFDENIKQKKNLSLFNRRRPPNYIKQKITLRQRFDVVYGLFCVWQIEFVSKRIEVYKKPQTVLKTLSKIKKKNFISFYYNKNICVWFVVLIIMKKMLSRFD